MNSLKWITACFVGVLFCGGCSFFGGGSSSPANNAAVAAPAACSSAPAGTAAGKAPAVPGDVKEEHIRKDLEHTGKTLVGMAANNVTPKKTKKTVRRDGTAYVAMYSEVDRDSLSTSMQPCKSGQYIGFVRYVERQYECRGASKATALKAPCSQVASQRMNELIRYDGKRWNY